MKIEILPIIDSTNSEMKRRAQKAKLESEFVLMANEQTHGRGRGERTWNCRSGESLAASYWIELSAQEGVGFKWASSLPLIVGLAMVKAAQKRLISLGRNKEELSKIGLKWPNDVLVKGQGKLAGILCELVHNRFNFGIVAGIGVNLQDSEGALHNLPRPASVWSEVFQDNWKAKEACEDIGCELFNLVKRLAVDGFTALAGEWYDHCLHKELDTAVIVGLSPKDSDFNEGSVRFGDKASNASATQGLKVGKTVGLGEHGELLLLSGEGQIVTITIGDVSF